MINVTTATTAELISFFNEHSETPVKKFQDRKTAERRVSRIIELLEASASTGASQVLADEIGSEDPTDAKIDESNNPDDFGKMVTDLLKDKPVAPVKTKKARKAKEAKVAGSKVHEDAKVYMVTALADGKMSAMEIFRGAMASYPMTRVQIRHTAAAAGMHPLSARNAYDRIHGVK